MTVSFFPMPDDNQGFLQELLFYEYIWAILTLTRKEFDTLTVGLLSNMFCSYDSYFPHTLVK